jgi:predicted nucleic acid-binding Zn ribbon protein
MRRRTATQKLEPLGGILQKVLKKWDIPYKNTDRRLVDLWERAVGPPIALHTIPENLKRGSLYVLVSSPGWLHQLQFLKEEIRSKLNKLAGREEFRRIFFVIGTIPERSPGVPDTKPTDSTSQKLEKRDLQMLKQSLASIRDDELREIIEKVMITEIIRRRGIQKRQGL